MSFGEVSCAFQIARIAAVVALLVAAAVVAAPKGRLPLALRGVMRVLRRDGAAPDRSPAAETVKPARKFLAFVLVLVAVLLCLVR